MTWGESFTFSCLVGHTCMSYQVPGGYMEPLCQVLALQASMDTWSLPEGLGDLEILGHL